MRLTSEGQENHFTLDFFPPSFSSCAPSAGFDVAFLPSRGISIAWPVRHRTELGSGPEFRNSQETRLGLCFVWWPFVRPSAITVISSEPKPWLYVGRTKAGGTDTLHLRMTPPRTPRVVWGWFRAHSTLAWAIRLTGWGARPALMMSLEIKVLEILGSKPGHTTQTKRSRLCF